MANQEGVDIIIKATDQYTKTINNITASNELFGKSIKSTEKEIAALKKYMIELRVNGVDPLDERLVELKAIYDKLTESLNSGEGAVKKTNMQFTNLALVIQDLPYGFRGIQNNLPALLGSIAGVGGAAYLAFSVIIALYTAFGDQINDAILKTTNFEKAQKELGKSTIEAAKSTETARTEILKVTSVIQAAKDGYIDKSAAIQLYNDKLGDSFGKVSSLGEAEQALVDKAPKYIEALNLKAKAEFYFAKAAEFAVKKDIAGLEDQTSALDKLLITAKTVAQFGDVAGVKGIIKTLVEGIGQAQTEGVNKVKKTAGTIADVLTEEGKKSMSAYFKALKESGITDADIQSIIDKLNQQLLKTQLKNNQDRLKAIETANQAEIKAFTETLNERDKKEYEAGLRLAKNLEIMREAGYTDATTYYSAYRAEMDNIATYYNDKELAEAQKVANKIASIQLDMRFKMQSAIASINEKFAKEEIKTNNTRLNATLKATRGDYQAQKAAIEEAILANEAYRQSAVEAGYGTEEFDAAAVNLKAQLEGLLDPLEQFNNSLRNILSTTFADFLAAFGQGFASMFNGGGMEEAMNNFLSILADGLIQVGKLAIATGLAIEGIKAALKSLNPVLAVAAGIALVGLGSYVKNSLSKSSDNLGSTKKFANGGIISGPTMGLMGEYPGAASNPEVVAPLDKLKSLIGNAGGSLEARISGNDLLILMNKASRNNQNTF